MSVVTTPGWHFQNDEKKKPTLMYYIPKNPILTHKIAGFDFVNTLIWSDRGDYTVRGAENWVWRSETLPEFISELMTDEEPWTVAIFSNYISKNFEELQYRVETVQKDIQAHDVFFFASLMSDYNQKPRIGMWKAFVNIWESLSGETLIPDKNSFYIGDRAGDPSAEDPMFRKGKVELDKYDSILLQPPLGDDSLFAARIGLNFVLPSDLPGQPEPTFPQEQELIIMVGQQGSGKTTWALRIVQEHTYALVASEETPSAYVVKDKKRRFRMIEQLLEGGESVIVDATHPSRASRQELIMLAQKYNVPVRIFWVSRPGRPYNETREKPVSEIALRIYTKNFERPSKDEGVKVVRLV